LRESSFEIRAVPIWHVIILMMLSLFVIAGAYAVSKNIAGGIEDGIKFRIYFIRFSEISRIKLRLGGRLMTYGEKLDLGYILLNPKKFVEAIRVFKPEALAEYRSH